MLRNVQFKRTNSVNVEESCRISRGIDSRRLPAISNTSSGSSNSDNGNCTRRLLLKGLVKAGKSYFIEPWLQLK